MILLKKLYLNSFIFYLKEMIYKVQAGGCYLNKLKILGFLRAT